MAESENLSIEDDELDRLLFSNLEENDPSESYLLSRSCDDQIGHKARQTLRDEAAGTRDVDHLYYYLTRLVSSFGSSASKKKEGEKKITQVQFNALITSIPTLDAYLSSKDGAALFCKLDTYRRGVLDVHDLIHFCLLDKTQM